MSLCAVFVTSVFTVKKQVTTVKLLILEWSLVYQSIRWTDSQEQSLLKLIIHINQADLPSIKGPSKQPLSLAFSQKMLMVKCILF